MRQLRPGQIMTARSASGSRTGTIGVSRAVPRNFLMPPITTALIVANVAIYLLQSVAPGIELTFALWPIGAAQASGVQVSFEIWQVVTYGFLHGGLTHLLFNMFALYMFGGAME